MSGKLKMALQCLAALLSLIALAQPAGQASEQLTLAVAVAVWAAVALTIYSGAAYVLRAIALLRA
jgi:phosphatidylglycerophosphate synthase